MNNEMAAIKIPLPPIEEQLSMLNNIERLKGEVDSTTSKLVTQITKLREYRATLIDAAVTGKVRVS